MVVQHNLQAMNSNRMLGITQGTLSKSTEKLSSGYKINRAADNAAGLAISEKMRKQIRGLTQASANAEDGISAVQTAEGALTEVHDMLQRMNELANQAANGTQSATDRQYIQDEISQLTTEIDRVSETTKFNEIYLLKGNEEGLYKETKANAHDAGINGKLVDNGNKAVFSLEKALEDGDKINIAGEEYTIGEASGIYSGDVLKRKDMNTDTSDYADLTKAADFKDLTGLKAGDSFTFDGETYTLTDKIKLDDIKWTIGDTFQIGEHYYTIAASNLNGATADGTSAKPEQITEKDAKKAIADALEAGQQVYATKFSAKNEAGADTAVTDKTQVVSEYGKNEVSMAGIAGAAAGTAKLSDYAKKANAGETVTFKSGDIYTQDGVTITAATVPTSARAAYDILKKLNDGDTITIGTGEDAKTYTIVSDNDEEDADSYRLHLDTILSMIHDGDLVNYTGATSAITVIGDIGVPEDNIAEESTISAEEAYAKITEELQKASSIGTDEGKEASVKSDGKGNFTITKGSITVKDDLNFNLHVGADADMTNKIGVDIRAMSTAGLGIKDLKVTAADENGKAINDDGITATYAIDAISDAIEIVSRQRSALGAVQNRLEHTIKNLDNVVENTQSAESAIRDTDMADEMVRYSNNNILAQAGQSMLAQANQSNQGVLSLLG